MSDASEPLGMIRSSRAAGQNAARTAILRASEELLSQYPLQSLSVTRIIEAADVSRPTFYAHFATKYSVVAELLGDVVASIDVGVTQWSRDSPHSTVQAMRSSFTAIGATWFEHRHVMRSVVEHSSSAPEIRAIWSEAVTRFTEAVAHLIDSEREAGRAPAGMSSLQLAAGILWSAERIWFVSSLGLDPHLPTLDAAIDVIVSIAHGAIYAGAAAAD